MEEVTWGELRRLAHKGAVAMVPVSPLEDHGAHLPCGVDVILAREFSHHLALWLERQRGLDCLMHPPLVLGAQRQYSLGCLRTASGTVRRSLIDLGRELAAQGCKTCVLVTAHAALSHLTALERACRKVSGSTSMTMLNPCAGLVYSFLKGGLRGELERALGRRFSGDEWKALKADYHAGAWETSLMLKFRPELVADFYPELPPQLTVKGHRGYFGSPALARPALGEAAVTVITERVGKRILKGLEPARPSRKWMVGVALGLAGVSFLSARSGKLKS